MENISQKPPGKRGRPRKHDAFAWSLTDEGRDAKSHRHYVNYIYHLRALAVLIDDRRFAWLCSTQAAVTSRTGKLRVTILSELGRIEDVQELEAMALEICERQPTTREAVALLRRARIRHQPRGTVEHCADALRQTFNTYLATHSPLSWDDHYAVLDILRDHILTRAENALETRACWQEPACTHRSRTQPVDA